MTEAIVRQRICNLWGECVPGVVTWFYEIPRVLQDGQLPAVVVFPGAAIYDKSNQFGEEIMSDTRIYEMVLYLAKALFGTQGALQIDADPYFTNVRNAFAARPGLELPSEGANQSYCVFNSMLLGDGDEGLQSGPYPLSGADSPSYVQIRWRLQVQELSPVNYRD